VWFSLKFCALPVKRMIEGLVFIVRNFCDCDKDKKPGDHDYCEDYHISEIKRTTMASKTGRLKPMAMACKH